MKGTTKPIAGSQTNSAGKIFNTTKQLRNTLDFLREGIQIIDFSWHYVYVNSTIAEYAHTTSDKLIGRSLIEPFPGVKQGEVFVALEQCMTDRKEQQIEIEFVNPDGSRKWFELSIEPVNEGVMLVSLDITKHKEADEKMAKASNLYAFISQINQNIVRVKDEATLFHNACKMALDFGKFSMAWIGMYDHDAKEITLIAQSGIPAEDVKLFQHVPFQNTGPQDYVMHSGKIHICNDIEHDLEWEHWRPYGVKHNIQSSMVLPLKRFGKIIGSLNLYSTVPNFSTKAETALLVEIASDISFALDLFEKERKHLATEKLVIKSEKRFRHTLNNMLEGVQIHDFEWRYIYVNDALVSFGTHEREELIGSTLMEKFPGIEQTPLFSAMQKCMTEREATYIETEFTFPNGKEVYFELSIHPIPEGIFVLSLDRTEQKKAKEKLLKVNRLYAFISAINQSIVHISNEKVLLDNACKIAFDIGQFKMVWIGLVDVESGALNIVSMRGTEAIMKASRIKTGIDSHGQLLKGSLVEITLRTGKYAVSNTIQDDPAMHHLKIEFIENDIKAGISFPIKKFGKVVGAFGFYSVTENFFDEHEISLLEEASGDISFAMEHFEKAEKHKVAEELILANEHRFRSLIENSTDMISLVNASGELSYISPSVSKLLGYSQEELLYKHDHEFIHPDDIQDFEREVKALIPKPGESFSNQQRVLRKNGTWMWCEGTVTNLLHQSDVQAIVSNFRDISDKKSLEQSREFDSDNLNALINNTSDLMWSVDKEFKLITFNQPMFDITKLVTGHELAQGI